MKRRSNFTLVELMVAMGVFVILLMVSMQVFSGSRKLWVRSEQKNSAFAAARIAMEFVAARVQTCIYTENMPFGIYEQKSSGSQRYYTKIFFPTSMPMNRMVEISNKWEKLDEFDLRFIGFSLSSDGVLEMRIFSDGKRGSSPYQNFTRLLPPYRRRRGAGGSESYDSAWSKIHDQLQDASGDDLVAIIENVTSFKLVPFDTTTKNSNDPIVRVGGAGVDTLKTPPYLLEIEISVIDSKANFKKWVKADADGKEEIETESGYTFRRAVLLGDRRNER